MPRIAFFTIIILFAVTTLKAQLVVAVASPKVVGQKAIVSLAMTNSLSDTIESARAICFLMDEQGKMVGQSAKWVVGRDRTGLAAGSTGTFNFVVTPHQSFASSNLIAKVSFSSVTLEGGKPANIKQSVKIVSQISE